jgi:tetratricopeptide (TPR) repeat protein
MFSHCIEKHSRLALLLPVALAFLSAEPSLNLLGQDRLKTTYETAQQLFQQGKDAEARVHFQALLVETYRARAVLYRQQGLWARVQTDLEAVVDLRPDNDPGLDYELAEAYFRQADYLQAARKLEALIPRKLGDTKVHGLLGRAYFSLGKLEAARRELQTAQNLDPADLLSAYTLALAALSQKDREVAARIFAELGKRQGFSAHFHLLAGRAYLDADFHAEAQTELRQALRLDSKTRFARYLLALSLLRERGTPALEQAKEELSQELDLFPDEFASHYLLGLMLEFERRWQKAAAAFQQSVVLAPNEPDAHFHLGSVCLKLDRRRQAAESLHRALALTNRGCQSRFQAYRAHYLLSQAYRAMGDLKVSALEAEAARSASSQLAETERKASEAPTLQAMLENLGPADSSVTWRELTPRSRLSPNQENLLKVYVEVLTNGHHCLGLMAVRQQQFDEAARQFSRVAELQPDFPDVDLNVGIALFQAEEYAKALEPLARHLKRNPSHVVTRKYLGLTYFQREQYNEAAKLLQEVRNSGSPDAQVLLALGTSLVRLHQTQEAQKIFTELLQAYPDSGR